MCATDIIMCDVEWLCVYVKLNYDSWCCDRYVFMYC